MALRQGLEAVIALISNRIDVPTECDKAAPCLVQVDNAQAVIRVSANQGQDRNDVSFPQNLQKQPRKRCASEPLR